jgi:DNA-binding CsgD family transcriptional regulator
MPMVSYRVDQARGGGSGGTLESSAGAGPSIDSVTTDPTPGVGLRNEGRRRLCSCRVTRSMNRSCRRCWPSVRSRNFRYRCCRSLSSLVGDITNDVSQPVPRVHRGRLRDVLRTSEQRFRVEVLRLIGEGLSARQIGERLYIATSTVESHQARLYEKLGVSDRAAAVAEGMRLGLLE